MQQLQVVLAAALAALTFDASAESHPLQDARRGAWTLLERSAEKLPSLPAVSPDSAELGWLRSSGLKPGRSLQLDLARDWSVCADWDRQRPKVAPLRETIDTFLLGLSYRF